MNVPVLFDELEVQVEIWVATRSFISTVLFTSGSELIGVSSDDETVKFGTEGTTFRFLNMSVSFVCLIVVLFECELSPIANTAKNIKFFYVNEDHLAIEPILTQFAWRYDNWIDLQSIILWT